MHTPDSKSFFRHLYENLGSLLLAGGLRGLAWWPLLIAMSLSEPGSGVSKLYAWKTLGFLLLALILDPFLAGGAVALARDLAAGGKGGPGAIRRGLGRRYPALLGWSLLQAAVAGLLLFNLSQLLSRPVALPALLAYLAPALTLWAWLTLRAMNLHLPGRLAEGHSLGAAMAISLQTVLSRPFRHIHHLIFRFGMTLLILASGLGAVLGLGSFGVLHGFLAWPPPAGSPPPPPD